MTAATRRQSRRSRRAISAGNRETDAVLHLYKLYMAFAEIDQATRIMRDFVTDRPDDPAAVAMLAKHYGDIQSKGAEIRTLERLFELAPSLQIARDLLAHYRLEGTFDREAGLLRTLLANQMIPANDAERLGLMLAAQGDLYGARDALTRFDEIANPERSHRTARLVRHTGANRRQDDCPEQGGVMARALAQARHSSDRPARKSPRLGSFA